MKTVPSYSAVIYCGTREGYNGPCLPLDQMRAECQRYVDEVGACVTFTPTEYIYTKGSEPGVIVGFINYPRFTGPVGDIKVSAIALAKRLQKLAKQMRCSVACSDETIMIEQADLA